MTGDTEPRRFKLKTLFVRTIANDQVNQIWNFVQEMRDGIEDLIESLISLGRYKPTKGHQNDLAFESVSLDQGTALGAGSIPVRMDCIWKDGDLLVIDLRPALKLSARDIAYRYYL